MRKGSYGMAIIEMKRLTLLAPKEDKDKLLRAMQHLGCVEVTSPEDGDDAFAEHEDTGTEATRTQMQRVVWALGQLKKYDPAGKVMFGCYPEVPIQEAEAAFARQAHYMALVEKLEGFERRRGELKAMETRALAGIEQYTPWRDLDTPPRDALASTARVCYLAGLLPARNLDALEKKLALLEYAALTVVGPSRENVCVIVALHRAVEADGRAALEEADFTAEGFSALGDKTPGEYLSDLHARLDQIAVERENMHGETAAMAGEIPGLKLLHEMLSQQLQRQEAAGRFAVTESTFLLRGWVPAPSEEKLRAKIKKLSPVSAMELRDPLPEEQPPIKLRNNRFASPFESVVEGYSLPDYRGIDPTAVMAPFYACLFGMMVSDAGYGLVMALLIPIFMKIKKIKFENAKMLYLLTYGGIATIVWGLIYNTVFGFNPLPRNLWLLDSVNNSLPVMAVCIGVGALHLFTGLGVGAYMNFKRGQPLAALADQIAWLTLLCGVGMLLLPATQQAGMILALASVAVILLFTKRGERNPLKRIFGGLGALYGITSWVSDLLSYMRLFGMGLATGVIGMVFNQLIGMIWGAGIIGKVIGAVLFVACHAFNLGINALGAYVHSCRLQYIEFFGKFYEDGGKPFSPLTVKPTYVSLQPSQADD